MAAKPQPYVNFAVETGQAAVRSPDRRALLHRRAQLRRQLGHVDRMLRVKRREWTCVFSETDRAHFANVAEMLTTP
jgi:hypothetical protein